MKTDSDAGHFQLCLCKFWTHRCYYYIVKLIIDTTTNLTEKKLENIYSRRSFICMSKHGKHPNNVIIEGRFGIVVPKATTAVSNFLSMCAVVDGS
jgi:hypothetical protein